MIDPRVSFVRLVCSIPIGCLIPQFSTNFKPIFQCAFKPAYEIGELNCRRFCHSHVSRSWLISPDGCKWRTCTQKETQCLNAPQSGAFLKWNKCPGGQGYFPRVENLAIIRFALARKIRPLKNQSKFWSRLTFLNKRLILLRSLKNCSGEILWKFPTSGTGVGDS